MGTFLLWILVARVGVVWVGEERMGSVEGVKCGRPSGSICIVVSSSCCVEWSGCIDCGG